MRLSGRLRDTTLGDLLGTVGRGGVTGVVTLTETSGPSAGRRHQVHFDRGSIVAVESEPQSLEPGDVLDRLSRLFRIADAAIQFHVLGSSRRDRPAQIRLSPIEAVRGRPRARDLRRTANVTLEDAERGRRRRALEILGLDEQADPPSIRRAFRQLAARLHPDRANSAGDEERRRLERDFAELSSAYHVLMG